MARWPAAGRAVGVGLAGVLVLAGLVGCSPDDSPGVSAPTGSGSPPPSWAAAGEVPRSRAWIERPSTGLDYYADLVSATNLRMSEKASGDGGAWEVKQEEFIAGCMKEAGFEYYPSGVDPAEGGESDISLGEDGRLWVAWLPDDLAEVERYGYGYWVPGDSMAVQVADESVEPDANSVYVAALSPSAAQAYRVALMGAELAAYDLADFESVAVPDMGGCMGAANEAHPYPVAQEMEESPTALYKDLLDLMYDQARDLYSQTFLRRAEVDALNDEWWDCFELDFPGARPLPDPRLDPAFVAEQMANNGEFNGPSYAWDMAISTNAEGEHFNPGPEGKQAPAEFASLTGTPREIAIAVADYRCRQETDYVDRLLALQRQAHEQFIAAHQTDLEQMAAAMEDYINS
ncbi:MAG: hypothetical protein LBD77_02870 [Bifidobacteriaceae bacterium]|jgi:hypothetical protein|nr:hypothetical protein [Bifidobacteriaceae bacterium]